MEEKYLEYFTFEWKKSKSKFVEVEAVDEFMELLPAEYYKNGECIFVIKENQLYKAKHIKHLKKI